MESGQRILITGGGYGGMRTALLFPREVVSLDVLEHPRQDFRAALRVIATRPSHKTPFPGQHKREAEYHAYHR